MNSRSFRPLAAGLDCAVAVALWAGLALAQDGGSRSVFAEGSGARALAMGGAFAAIADDASAALWNPGGLGRVPRLQLEAMQTSFFGLGIQEAYAAVVVPSWRWGTATATLRHLGVDGIERRDDRNLLQGEFSDSETEFLLGYGRSASERWSFGATLKARRQSLAGLSASGFGVDVGLVGQPAAALGVRAPWAEQLTWGLAITNLVAPSLRLDVESVHDQQAVRSGFALRRSVGVVGELVTAVDFDFGSSTHAGLELRPIQALALRAGVSDGAMTAGTGIRWRGGELDYVFENRALDAVHRVGLSFALGPTVQETRAAALRAEEDRLQARLNEGFQKRQNEQVSALLSSASERRAAGDYEEAIRLLSTVATLDPARTDAVEMEAACHRDVAAALENGRDFAGAAIEFGRALALVPSDSIAAQGRRRSEQESHNRSMRSADLNQVFIRSLEALGADDLVTARRGFNQLVTANPRDEEAARLLKRADEAIGRRASELIVEAGRSIETNQLAEAQSYIDQAAALSPRSSDLSSARAALGRARERDAATRAQRAKPTPAPSDPVTSAEPRLKPRELEALYRRGVAAIEQRRSDEAIRYWELVWAADPRYQRVSDYLKREYLARGMESFAAGRLDDAVRWWQQALTVDPSDQRARGYLERAKAQLARTREILGAR